MIPSERRAGYPAGHAPTTITTHARPETMTLKYLHLMEEDDITVSKMPDVKGLSEEQTAQTIRIHLLAVLGSFLSQSRMGERYFLYGSTAMALHLKEHMSPSSLRKMEEGWGVNPTFYFPLFEDEWRDFDLICSRADPGSESINKLLLDSLGDYGEHCEFIVQKKPGELNIITDDPEIADLNSRSTYLIVGLTQKTVIKHNNKTILTVDITYPPPPNEEPAEKFKHVRPYLKEAELKTVQFGECRVEINVTTAEQSLEDLITGFRQTPHLPVSQNKFLSRLETIVRLVANNIFFADKPEILSKIICAMRPPAATLRQSTYNQVTQVPETKTKNINTDPIPSKIAKGKRRQIKATVSNETDWSNIKQCGQGIQTVPQHHEIETQTDITETFDSDKMQRIRKTIANKSTQTTLPVQIQTGPSVRPKTRMQSSGSSQEKILLDNNKNKEKQIEEFPTKIDKLFKEKLGKKIVTGKAKYIHKQKKDLCNIEKILTTYKELQAVCSLEEYLDRHTKDSYIKLFEVNPTNLMSHIKNVIEDASDLDDRRLVQLKVNCYLGFIELIDITRNARFARLKMTITDASELRTHLQIAEHCHFELMLHVFLWVRSVLSLGNGKIKHGSLLQQLPDVMIARYKELIESYQVNSMSLNKYPLALHVIEDAIYCLENKIRPDIKLLHIKLCIKYENYREKNKSEGTFPMVEVLLPYFKEIENPLPYASEIDDLIQLSFLNEQYLYAGVCLCIHMGWYTSDQKYRAFCIENKLTPNNQKIATDKIYDALTCPVQEPEVILTYGRYVDCFDKSAIQFFLNELSVMFTRLLLDEQNTFTVRDGEAEQRMAYWKSVKCNNTTKKTEIGKKNEEQPQRDTPPSTISLCTNYPHMFVTELCVITEAYENAMENIPEWPLDQEESQQLGFTLSDLQSFGDKTVEAVKYTSQLVASSSIDIKNKTPLPISDKPIQADYNANKEITNNAEERTLPKEYEIYKQCIEKIIDEKIKSPIAKKASKPVKIFQYFIQLFENDELFNLYKKINAICPLKMLIKQLGEDDYRDLFETKPAKFLSSMREKREHRVVKKLNDLYAKMLDIQLFSMRAEVECLVKNATICRLTYKCGNQQDLDTDIRTIQTSHFDEINKLCEWLLSVQEEESKGKKGISEDLTQKINVLYLSIKNHFLSCLDIYKTSRIFRSEQPLSLANFLYLTRILKHQCPNKIMLVNMKLYVEDANYQAKIKEDDRMGDPFSKRLRSNDNPENDIDEIVDLYTSADEIGKSLQAYLVLVQHLQFIYEIPEYFKACEQRGHFRKWQYNEQNIFYKIYHSMTRERVSSSERELDKNEINKAFTFCRCQYKLRDKINRCVTYINSRVAAQDSVTDSASTPPQPNISGGDNSENSLLPVNANQLRNSEPAIKLLCDPELESRTEYWESLLLKSNPDKAAAINSDELTITPAFSRLIGRNSQELIALTSRLVEGTLAVNLNQL